MILAKWLEKSGTTQSEFAEKIGVTASMVSQMITGHRPIPGGLVLKICRETAGAVTPEEMRPDLYPPGLVRNAEAARVAG